MYAMDVGKEIPVGIVYTLDLGNTTKRWWLRRENKSLFDHDAENGGIGTEQLTKYPNYIKVVFRDA
jgi:hypothetical protein